jgi:hypothetical protein
LYWVRKRRWSHSLLLHWKVLSLRNNECSLRNLVDELTWRTLLVLAMSLIKEVKISNIVGVFRNMILLLFLRIRRKCLLYYSLTFESFIKSLLYLSYRVFVILIKFKILFNLDESKVTITSIVDFEYVWPLVLRRFK